MNHADHIAGTPTVGLAKMSYELREALMKPPAAKPTLETPLAQANLPAPADDVSRTYEMQGDRESDTLVKGWVITEHEHDLRDGRYFHLRIFQTDSGAYVAALGNRSTNPGETSYWQVAAVQTVGDVMEHFGYMPAVKKMARQLGWNVKRRFA